MHVLVLNCGSSSIRYRLLDMAIEGARLSGLVESIGAPASRWHHRVHGTGGAERETVCEVPAPGYLDALRLIFGARGLGAGDGLRIDAIGHRVVHGGSRFQRPARVDAATLAGIRATIPLAPLHNPANLSGIEACAALFPEIPQVAVFDTAFHHTLPPVAYRYAIPEAWFREHHVRRYGFHGTSHAHVAARAADELGRPLAALALITLHLGNGASAAAIEGGRCVDTSMGMTPLEGLVMGTRCGDLDPAIPRYMTTAAGLAPEVVDATLNRDSGLKALCGDSDMRTILDRVERGDAAARLAFDVYVYRVRKYVGAYLAVLGRADAIVFTGGIGEHAAPVRAAICAGLECFGIRIDAARNAAARGTAAIHAAGAGVALFVVPTDEELEIARQTRAALVLSAGDQENPSTPSPETGTT